MQNSFAINFLTGLTNFVFDINVLRRIAARRGIADAVGYDDIDENTERLCTRDLLLTIVRGPWSTASSTNKHGSFEKVIGQQTITANNLEEIKSQIRQLNNELGFDEEEGLPSAPTNVWVSEEDWE